MGYSSRHVEAHIFLGNSSKLEESGWGFRISKYDCLPSGKHTKNIKKLGNQLFPWPCSIAMLNYQRVRGEMENKGKSIWKGNARLMFS